MADLGRFILDLYRPMIEFQFQHHPDKEAAVSRLMSGDCPAEETDLLFAEAEAATWKWFREVADRASADGTVVFKMYKGGT